MQGIKGLIIKVYVDHTALHKLLHSSVSQDLSASFLMATPDCQSRSLGNTELS